MSRMSGLQWVFRGSAHRLQLRGQLRIWPMDHTRAAPNSLFSPYEGAPPGVKLRKSRGGCKTLGPDHADAGESAARCT